MSADAPTFSGFLSAGASAAGCAGRGRAANSSNAARGFLDGLEGHGLAAVKEVLHPVAHDAELALPRRHGQTVVTAVREPREQTRQRDLARLERAVVQTETATAPRFLWKYCFGCSPRRTATRFFAMSLP